MDKRFRVTFFYKSGSVERSCEVEAPDRDRAAAKALLERMLPAEFIRDEPIFFLPESSSGWPLISNGVIAFGAEEDAHSIVYSVEELPRR